MHHIPKMSHQFANYTHVPHNNEVGPVRLEVISIEDIQYCNEKYYNWPPGMWFFFTVVDDNNLWGVHELEVLGKRNDGGIGLEGPALAELIHEFTKTRRESDCPAIGRILDWWSHHFPQVPLLMVDLEYIATHLDEDVYPYVCDPTSGVGKAPKRKLEVG